MKKYLILFIALSLFSCSGEDEIVEPLTPTEVNEFQAELIETGEYITAVFDNLGQSLDVNVVTIYFTETTIGLDSSIFVYDPLTSTEPSPQFISYTEYEYTLDGNTLIVNGEEFATVEDIITGEFLGDFSPGLTSYDGIYNILENITFFDATVAPDLKTMAERNATRDINFFDDCDGTTNLETQYMIGKTYTSYEYGNSALIATSYTFKSNGDLVITTNTYEDLDCRSSIISTETTIESYMIDQINVIVNEDFDQSFSLMCLNRSMFTDHLGRTFFSQSDIEAFDIDICIYI